MIGIIALLVLFLAAGWEAYYRKNWIKGSTVKLHFPVPAVYEGREAHLEEVIANRKRMPVPVLEVAYRVQRGLKIPDAENVTESDYLYKRDVFSLLGREQITRTYKIEAEKRGHYVISQAALMAPSLLEGVRYSVDLDESDEFYVYARRTSIRGILGAYETLLGETESTRKVFEDPFAFSQIREYTTRDPMKTINWKASARTGRLMVNTYTSVRSEQIRIYLDVEDKRIIKQTPLSEEAISIAATLTEHVLARSHPVSFISNTEQPFVLESARGHEQLAAIEQFLTTDFSEGETGSMEALLEEYPPEPGEIVVLISKNESDSLYEAAGNLARKWPVLWVVPVERGENTLHASTGTLRILRHEVNYRR